MELKFIFGFQQYLYSKPLDMMYFVRTIKIGITIIFVEIS